jgi:hypothetical protein
MDYKATLMVLVLVSSTLAGCTGDPDGGGNDEIDSDALQNLFDEHFQDFLNNTTITVNNHYYNNSTYVTDDGDYSSTTNVEYNNTTINEGDQSSTNNYNNQTDNDYSSSSLNYSLNGSGGGSVVQAFRVVWDPDERVSPTNFGARELVINGTVQVPGWTGSELSYQYNGYLIKLSFTCEEFVNAYHNMQNENWENWIFGEYGGSQSQAQNLGYSISQDIGEIYWDSEGSRGYCWSSSEYYPPIKTGNSLYFQNGEYDEEIHYTTVFEISLSTGQAIDFIALPYLWNVTLECDDGFGSSSNNGSQQSYPYLGGHTQCTVRGVARIATAYSYVTTSMANGSGPSLQTPEWYNGGSWYVFTNLDNVSSYNNYPVSSTPSDFLVYFTMHFVQVYEHDLE